MTRLIKFRAFVQDVKEMQSVLMIWLNGDNYGLQFTNGTTTTLSTTAAKEGVKLMQFTGLKDKNGKEIYEGDICKCHDHPTGIEDATGEVIFDQGRYWIGTGSICSLDDYGTAWTEVLGNIYENPELIPRAAGAVQLT